MESVDTEILTFPANHGAEWSTFSIAFAITIMGVITTIYLLRKKASPKNRNLNLVIAMLSFFAFMIAGGTSLFSFLTVYKLKKVEISETEIKTGYGTTELKRINKIFFHNDVQRSRINPGLERRSTRFLIVEEIGGKTHALSEEHYKIGEIYGVLKEKTKQ